MNSTTLKQQLEAAQQEITKLQQALEEAERQEKASSTIKLNLPKSGEHYKNSCGNYPSLCHTEDGSKYYLSTFASTNYKQAESFADALSVMAEMCMQEGIVNPSVIDNSPYYNITYNYQSNNIDYDLWSTAVGMSLFPCYATKEDAKKAVQNVGEQNIINCIKTMNFMTPESRGETNDTKY